MMLAYRSAVAKQFFRMFQARAAALIVQKLLNFKQKQRRMDITQEMLMTFNDDPDFAITGDESWVYGYDIETKAQSSQLKRPEEPRPKKARQVRSNLKVLLIVFFDCNGVMHHEFLPQGRTVNEKYYLEIMGDCAKQFVRNAQNCGKTNHGFAP